MPTLKQELNIFLDNSFKGLTVQVPLFYNWDFGLRFELGIGDSEKEYFDNSINRAVSLFESTFDKEDDLILVIYEYKWRKMRMHHSNYIFRQIRDFKSKEKSFSKIINLYDADGIFNRLLVKVKTEDINYRNMLTASAYSDSPMNMPWSRKLIFFINPNKKIIFNMYDDRGLDIIAADVNTLIPIYEKHKDWILNYDRNKIKKMFEEHLEA